MNDLKLTNHKGVIQNFVPYLPLKKGDENIFEKRISENVRILCSGPCSLKRGLRVI